MGVVAVLLSTGNSANAIDQYWHKDLSNKTGSNTSDYASGWRKLAIDDSFNGSATSAIFAAWYKGSDITYETCETVESGPCQDPTVNFIHGKSILPPCKTQSDQNCIVGLSASQGGDFQEAVLTKELQGFSFPASSAAGTPAGGTVSVWSSEKWPHSGGPNYAIGAQINWFRQAGATSFRDLTIRIAAVQERFEPGSRVTVPYTTENSVPGGHRLSGRAANHNPGKNGCFYTQDQVCGYEQEFSPNTRLKLVLRVSDKVTGWLYGRLKDPKVEISALGGGQNLLSIDAEPVRVGKLHAQWNVNDVPGVIDDRMSRGAFGDGNLMGGSTDSDAFAIVSKLRETQKDSATGEKTYWSLASVQGPRGCLNDAARLLGVVTTNSMVFSGGAPKFVDGFLKYEVAGMHYESDQRTLAIGTYDMVMRSDVARCLYGFSDAPVSATVSVIGDGQIQQIATTQVSERDGWLKLAAYGFTFSQKEIRVSFAQRLERNVTAFKGTTKNITARQGQELRTFRSQARSQRTFTCSVNYFQASRAVLAKQRAQAACVYLRTMNPFGKYLAVTVKTKSKSDDGQLLVVAE